MESEWMLKKLGDLVSHQKGYAFKSKDYREAGCGIARVSDFTERSIEVSSCKYLADELVSNHDSVMLKTGDIVVATVGSWPNNPESVVGKTIRVPPEANNFLLNQNAVKLSANSKIDQTFLFYLLKTHSFRDYIVSTAQGSANQASITLESIFDFLSRIPPLSEQKVIAQILGSLDDKIELNLRMNETLEGMTQALFNSWFVNFDPIIDNALEEGNSIPEELTKRAEIRRKALADGTTNREVAKQFPDTFQLTEEMGWIPEGWELTTIGDIASIIKGKSYKSSELKESNTALVTLKSFKRGGGYRKDGLKEYVGEFKPEQEVFSGDLVIAYTDVTQAADVIGKPAIIIANKKYDRLVISLDVAVVRPHSESLKYFLFGLTQSRHFQDHTASYSTGTTVLHLSKKAVPSYIFTLPKEFLLLEYQNFTKSIFAEIQNRTDQENNLSKLRDTLHLKLISGELRVPDAEKLVEEVL